MPHDLTTDRIRPLDIEAARARFAVAQPFPHIVLDDFLADGFARRLSAAYPSFDEACTWGRSYAAAHENRKVQVTDSERFPDPVRELHEELASPEFLGAMSRITGIPELLSDPALKGGGMHLTAPGGWLDVHVDFNIVPETGLHRRLNILVFLSEEWPPEWGGDLELWDRDVESCDGVLAPRFNRCVIFQTSEISYHGVRLIEPGAKDRKSFAAYYYTEAPPSGWNGERHSTIFKFRPGERLKRPGAALQVWLRSWSSKWSRRR